MIAALAAIVALAPVASMTEDAAGLTAIERTLAIALGHVPDEKVVPAAKVREALRAARRRDLESCEEPACLAELGRLVGAEVVVSGQAAGLAGGRVVYLKAVDVPRAALLRTTVLVLPPGGDPDPAEARAAAYRLLAPDAYVGQLSLKVDVAGAVVFVDGAELGRAPLALVPIAVGTHALRVTHPRYRDFVRFVEVRFGEATEVRADLLAYPVVSDDLRRLDGGGSPWYTRPWFIGVSAVGVAAITTAIVMLIPRDVSRDRDVVVGGH